MIKSDHRSITSRELLRFKKYQQKIFFQKADIFLSGNKFDLLNVNLNEDVAIPKIFAELGEGVKETTLLERSTLHKVFKVRTEKSRYALRVNLLNDLYMEFNFYIEDWVLKQLSGRELSNLKVCKIDISRKEVPFDYEIMDWAEGVTLYDLAKKQDLSEDLLFKLGQVIGKLHQIKLRNFGPLNVESIFNNCGEGIYNLWSDYVLKNFNKHLIFCLQKGIIDQSLNKKIVELLDNKRIPNLGNPVLLHGDIANHNVFTDGKNITALIDWEDCLSGDPVYDIAYYGTGTFNHPDWYDTFLSGYKSINVLPDDFYYRYWVYFLRISIAKAIIRFNLNTSKGKYLPSISERIKEGVKNLITLS